MQSSREEELLLRLAVRKGHTIVIRQDGDFQVHTGLLDSLLGPPAGEEGVCRYTVAHAFEADALDAMMRLPRPDTVLLIKEALLSGSVVTVTTDGAASAKRVIIKPSLRKWAALLADWMREAMSNLAKHFGFALPILCFIAVITGSGQCCFTIQ